MKALSISKIIIWEIYFEIFVSAFALPRNKGFKVGEVVSKSHGRIEQEPSCEELKKMWRFSKRQSRAAEITNEIPAHRDPFNDNVWEPYIATSRSIGGMRLGRYRTRPPVYGKIVTEPYLRVHEGAEKTKAFEEVARLYGNVQSQVEPRRRLTFRFTGRGHMPQLYPKQSGSFQHLKELIKTERARELQEQRRAEEAAAKAAQLKMLVSYENPNFQGQQYRDDYKYDDIEDVEDPYARETGQPQSHESRANGAVLAFPDLLAPAAHPARTWQEDPHFVQDYPYYTRGGRSQGFPLFDTGSYNTRD